MRYLLVMEYSHFNSIVSALKSVKQPGIYATGGVWAPMPLPAITINNFPDDILGLPLSEGQSKVLIECASQAPFGRGEETILDINIRRTWQLNPTQFCINNPEWEKQVLVLLDQVKSDLGCDPKSIVTCELYKLLLYEPGGFFKCHRDTEKSEGMFGTLVIQLPSNYSGGQLIVYHQSERKEFDFSGLAGCTNFHYAAFYADCQHEIIPVDKGYRLCLVYNLVCRGSMLSPTDNCVIVSSVVSAIKKWNSNTPRLMVYMLEHKYCEASLSFKSLKNTDRAVADVLTQAKSKVPFDLYLAQVSLFENWSATPSCYDSYGCYQGSDFEADELIYDHISATNLLSSNGQQVSSIQLTKEYLVPEGFFDTIDPDDEEFEEATGNEGATIDKQYSWAALLLWPSQNRTFNLGASNMIRLLEKDLCRGSIQYKKTSKVVAKDLLRLLAAGQTDLFDAESYASFLKSLITLDNVKLVTEFLEIISKSAYQSNHSSLMSCSTFCDEVVLFGAKYGWKLLLPSLQQMFAQVSSINVEIYCKFLLKISEQPPSNARKDLCSSLAGSILNVLAAEENKVKPAFQRVFTSADLARRDKGFVKLVFKCFTAVECHDQVVLMFVRILQTKPYRYPIVGTLAPFCEEHYKPLKGKRKASEALHQLLVYCISSLEASLKHAPSCPSNWSLPVPFSCSCGDCAELICYMKHPTKLQHRFKMALWRRSHLEDQLNENQCSVTYLTERVGSPHTLVVTKTRASYNKDRQRYQNEKAVLARLLALTGDSSSSGEPSVKRQKINLTGK